MKRTFIKPLSAIAAIVLIGSMVAGCSTTQATGDTITSTYSTTASEDSSTTSGLPDSDSLSDGTIVTANEIDASELFSSRDLEQSADLSLAIPLTLESGRDLTLNAEGVYLVSGSGENVTIVVDAADDAKVQIVLDGITITNDDSPAIYVKAADKVFVTTTDSQNSLEVSGAFVADGETNLDAIIYSKSDLTLNGTGTLDLVSATGNGISSKDDLVITGGVYTITTAADGLEANDAILISNGTLNIESGKDALHSENADDASLGYIVIENGTLNISATDDGIRGNSFVQIDGGTIEIATCREGIEANNVIINDGQITINSQDDGINATQKVSAEVSIVVNGGTISIRMASGDTDAFDSNGTIIINGGTITVEAQSAFDSNGIASLNGGTVTVNGQVITQITQTGPGGPGGLGGGGGGRVRR
ncbi:MAG: carbohydrate-binding domain-containing protein [Eubacteriales bacterium]|nr:carbohydrate-binding domain-containing protein [Eubacteriales bacterium]